MFESWGGDADGTGDSVNVEVDDEDLSVSATFVEMPTLTVKVEGEGSVTIDPEQDHYEPGAMVTVEAVAKDGWAFDHWSGDPDMGEMTSAKLVMDESKTVTAVFVEAASDLKTFFTTTWLDNGLDASDQDDFISTWKGLGYMELGSDEQITSSTLLDLLGRTDIGVYYHTGHGFDGSIQTSDGNVSVESIDTIGNQHFISATCLTMVPTTWMDKMGPTSQSTLGYSEVSLDRPVDNEVVFDFGDAIKNGRNYAQAWYDCNAKQSSLSDRWVIYWREESGIVEYSARDNSPPPSPLSPEVSQVAENLNVTNNLLNDSRTFADSYGALADNAYRVDAPSQEASEYFGSSGNEFLAKVATSHDSALALASSWIAGKLPTDAGPAQAAPIYARKHHEDVAIVAYRIRYEQKAAGLDFLTNGRSSHVEMVVNGNQLRSHVRSWRQVQSTRRASPLAMGNVLPVRDLIAASATHIDRYAKAPITLVDAKACVGQRGHDLVPAVALIDRSGLRIVVDARSGDLLD
jgi:hypothetical protein